MPRNWDTAGLRETPWCALSRRVGVPELASAFVKAVAAVAELAILGPPGSALLAAAANAGLPIAAEAFADRAYLPDGRLVPRGQPGAILTDPAAVADQVVALALRGEVTAVDGTVVPVMADSICLHSDTPDSVALARSVRTALRDAGVTVQAFA